MRFANSYLSAGVLPNKGLSVGAEDCGLDLRLMLPFNSKG